MKCLSHIPACIALILLQTVLFQQSSLFSNSYDLLIPFIVYITVFQTVREALIGVVTLGIFMDNLSGGPFGLFGTTYFFIFIIIIQLMTFLNLENPLLLSLIIAVGTLLENIILLFAIVVSGQSLESSSMFLISALNELIWAILTGYIIVTVLKAFHDKLDSFIYKVYGHIRSD